MIETSKANKRNTMYTSDKFNQQPEYVITKRVIHQILRFVKHVVKYTELNNVYCVVYITENGNKGCTFVSKKQIKEYSHGVIKLSKTQFLVISATERRVVTMKPQKSKGFYNNLVDIKCSCKQYGYPNSCEHTLSAIAYQSHLVQTLDKAIKA